MTLDEFWKLIDRARRGGGDDADETAARLSEMLSTRDPSDILDFERHFTRLHGGSYSWDLWGAAYLINGGCSDDGFEYFRGWLIAQGRKAFESALENPDSLAKIAEPEESECECECEEMLYLAREAYKEKTGKEMPDLPDLDGLFKLKGRKWDFDNDEQMKKRYPKLWKKFASGN